MPYEIKTGQPKLLGDDVFSNTKYPLTDMQIGEYFFVPNGKIQRISSAITQAMKNRRGCTMKKFVCRTITNEEGIKGIAVYRIAHPVFDTPEYQAELRSTKPPRTE